MADFRYMQHLIEGVAACAANAACAYARLLLHVKDANAGKRRASGIAREAEWAAQDAFEAWDRFRAYLNNLLECEAHYGRLFTPPDVQERVLEAANAFMFAREVAGAARELADELKNT